MLVRKPRYNDPGLFAVLLALGLAIELAVFVVGRFWAARYSAEPLSLGPVVFVLSLSCVYLGAQILNGLYAIELVAGMSLTLLAAMVAWVGLGLALIVLVFLMGITVYAVFAIPVRLLYFTLRPQP